MLIDDVEMYLGFVHTVVYFLACLAIKCSCYGHDFFPSPRNFHKKCRDNECDNKITDTQKVLKYFEMLITLRNAIIHPNVCPLSNRHIGFVYVILN